MTSAISVYSVDIVSAKSSDVYLSLRRPLIAFGQVRNMAFERVRSFLVAICRGIVRSGFPRLSDVFVQPCRLTIALIQIGAKGDVQPFDTG
jgi:hypothetical protein